MVPLRIFHLLSPLIVCAWLSACNKQANSGIDSQSVNALLGDESYIQTFGHKPDAQTNEQLRLQTHLAYVEKMLREKNVTHLSPQLQAQRAKMLALLREYRAQGIFPVNFDYPDQRRPCFIDREGRICAVGYLIEKSAGRYLAEAINAKYQYAYLSEMHDRHLAQWVATSGLTPEECAMIQPAYGPPVADNNIDKTYGISSMLITGFNTAFIATNTIQLAKGAHQKWVPLGGLISGAIQLRMGLVNYPEEQMTFWGNTINTTQRNLSMLNIGLGASTMALSGLNLIYNRKPKNGSMAWNIYSFPAHDHQVGLGFSLTKQL